MSEFNYEKTMTDAWCKDWEAHEKPNSPNSQMQTEKQAEDKVYSYTLPIINNQKSNNSTNGKFRSI